MSLKRTFDVMDGHDVKEESATAPAGLLTMPRDLLIAIMKYVEEESRVFLLQACRALNDFPWPAEVEIPIRLQRIVPTDGRFITKFNHLSCDDVAIINCKKGVFPPTMSIAVVTVNSLITRPLPKTVRKLKLRLRVPEYKVPLPGKLESLTYIFERDFACIEIDDFHRFPKTLRKLKLKTEKSVERFSVRSLPRGIREVSVHGDFGELEIDFPEGIKKVTWNSIADVPDIPETAEQSISYPV